MYFKLFLLSILFLNISLFAKHEDAKELFTEADCMSCHNPEDFAKRQNKVNSFKKLHKAVDACRFTNEAQWFDDESLDVTNYLNDKYYRFKIVPEK